MIDLSYLDDLKQLLGFLRKETGIGDIHLWKDRGDNIRGVLDPGDIVIGSGMRTREYTVPFRLMSPYECWEQLMSKMSIIEDKLSDCTITDEQNIKVKVYLLNSWSRIDDETNLIYEISLSMRSVRVNA